MTALERQSLHFKKPAGAVKTGEKIDFLLHDVPKGDFFLEIREDGAQESCLVPMKRNGNDLSCSYVYGREGLYFYSFSDDAGKTLTPSEDGWVLTDGCMAQQTVYSSEYEPACSFFGGIAYQIFPDRFATGGRRVRLKGRRYHRDLSEQPNWRPDPDGEFRNLDFYGGDLKGITDSLDYLSGLGVDLIYLNPIFESPSNHRYDTSDYMKIDPQLGTEDDLRELCRMARDKGIRIILDGVFSHTGDDSVYFNRYGRYPSLGAYQSVSSPYYSWYRFSEWPDSYSGWWGVRTLPEVTEEEPSYTEFITGKDGVIEHWMRTGVSGFRLDVADELPDGFIEKIRETVRRCDPEGLLIGEVWEDASNKISYSQRRKYFLGHELDGVMGYTFRSAILDFIASADAGAFREQIESLLLHYPGPMLNSCLNIIGSHDTARAINVLAAPDGLYMDRESQSQRVLSRDEYLRGVEMLKLAFALLFFLPGIPMIYYGDEAGMQGYGDPFCRCFFIRENADNALTDYVRELSALRNSFRGVLCDAATEFFDAGTGAVGFYRGEGHKRLAFLLNRSGETVSVNVFEDRQITAAPWSFSVIGY